MIAKGTALALAAMLLAALPARADDPNDPNARLIRLERWLKASLSHHPGENDDAAREVSLWTNIELKVLQLDIDVISRMFRSPGGRVSARVTQDRSIPPYTAWQIRQLYELADEYRGRSKNDVLIVRGAVLHGDIGMSDPSPVYTAGDSADTGRIKVLFGDGEPLGLHREPVHWEMARALFDRIKGNPAAEDIARRWYAATAMQQQGAKQHDTVHLRHARQLFPEDVDILFMSGTQQETYASPPVQSAARTAVLPVGVFVDIGREGAALRDAETYFRHALTLNPGHQEARLHLGHVLIARGRPQEAAEVLRPLTFPDADPELQYFTALFLGAAEEGSSRLDQAREAYRRAAMIFPFAQSPYIALSALATRRGDRAGALKEVQHVFDLTDRAPDDQDPWWAYDVSQTRTVDERLFALNHAVDEYR